MESPRPDVLRNQHPENIAGKEEQKRYWVGNDMSSWWYIMGRRYYFCGLDKNAAVCNNDEWKVMFDKGYDDAKGEGSICQ